MKSLTIPRLELMGVLIGARSLKFVKDELNLPIEKCISRPIHSAFSDGFHPLRSYQCL